MSEQIVNPFFPVFRNPLTTDFVTYNDGVAEVQQIDVERDALLNGENGTLLGTVGKVYKLVENEEVNRIFGEAFAALPIESTNDHLNWKSNRWQRDFILNGDQFNIMVGGEVVRTQVSIFNGYDGKSSVGFSIAAYRESNGMTLLSRVFGKTYSHVQVGLVDRIREDFTRELTKFQDMARLFDQWSRQSFGRESFERFVRSEIKTDDRGNTGFLSEKQADAIIESYESHLHRCGVQATRWGAFNVLASIAANDFQGRGNSSSIFTAGHKRMERLAKNFFEVDVEAELFTI